MSIPSAKGASGELAQGFKPRQVTISQLRMRATLQRRNQAIACRMWLFPWLTWAVIAFISGVLVVMFILPEHRIEVSSTLGLAVATVLLSFTTRRQGAQAGGRLDPLRSAG
ncbi:amino acid transporter, AAT family/GABA permease [Pseudomonas delhiensis]|uniref:Amino acid transporter, AAT family/GABA permease n=1 Tax=Pseudomonas delhiensis TaxID=366289 RepID=A0A239LZR3_9PSED|nr:amino acid transporter, AAT family/GABA permease [Pseudomonas delhiensis]SNT36006.1 hypothetical protein SAMN06295949_12312 [Pseudomonas delhiensis]